MTGKRLAAAGVLVAAAALWVVPHAMPATALRPVRHAQSTIATQLPASVALPTPTPQLAAPAPVIGLVTAGGALFALVLVGVVRQHRHSAVTVTARPLRRGRAPPSPHAHLHPARIRDH